ncbi:hypothetical protein FA15DRAFT_671144 [Coprinopsis marcescibilis]|uniref:Alpha/beta-hydrolase n=1 Tax=Coprinopsis marcescibilis TaxID=230819 RepID=A0A5C3KR04_COPMA|nr:hypothetical protein FA15DRAFT_671144 [Coprinopsis marcescibilis]
MSDRTHSVLLLLLLAVLTSFVAFMRLEPWVDFGHSWATAAPRSSLFPIGRTRTEFSWDTITPSKHLNWSKCYDGLQCARLEVPLNYSEPEQQQAVIAVVRKPALVPEKSPFYKGPVLLNPGGPGGSGVDLVVRAAPLFSVILGPQFDVVGFDPRGVGISTPGPSYFNNSIQRTVFSQRSEGIISDSGVGRFWAKAQLYGALVSENSEGYIPHINTPNTARDMLRIVEAHGREKLQYWGFSYGSVLGAVFATMFPDKVGRLVIDGVVDAEDYFATGWKTNLVDTDKAFDTFFTGCAEAGPTRCAFYSPDPEDIRRNLTSLFDRLRKQPIPARTETSFGLFDLFRLRQLIFVSLYQPGTFFSIIADGLAQLATGKLSDLFATLATMETAVAEFGCSCDPDRQRLLNGTRDAQATILCNDGAKVPEDFSAAEDYLEELSKISQFADIWAPIRIGCTGWPKQSPKGAFTDPFVAKTSHPLLIIGNTADPVTPLVSAKKMSKGFRDSVVLTQDSAGHCSISATSMCTFKHVRKYFTDGTLPDPGTVCNVIGTPFPPKIPRKGEEDYFSKPESQQALSDNTWDSLRARFGEEEIAEINSDPELWRAIEGLSMTYPLVPFHPGRH